MCEFPAFTLSPEEFSNAFPFHLAVDVSFHILQLGPSLIELCRAIRIGDEFSRHFTLERPKIALTPDALRSATKTTFIVRYNQTGLAFRYQVLSSEAGPIFFVGSPMINAVDSFAKYGLKFTHFSPHDALPDFLLVLEPKDLYLRDIKSLADRLNASSIELAKANELLIKKNEELTQARQMAEDKSKQLTALNKELKEAQAQLIQSEKLASVGRLSAGIAHELNQPLGVIALKAELSLAMAGEGRYDRIDTNLGSVLRQVKRATAIMDHLRVFGRDSTDVPREASSINKIIDNSLSMIGHQLCLKNIALHVELEELLPLVICNAVQIEQVMANLLLNAKDALETAEHKRITVRSSRKHNFVVIEVEDSGSGIPAALQAKIFDPFYTTKEVGKGTGLGLSISHSIIQNHKGQLSVSSREGQGATFTIELPYISTPQPIQRRNTSPSVVSSAGFAR